MSMSREEASAGEDDGRYPDLRQRCAWPEGEFSFRDEPGEHDPCYVVMPDGAMLTVNHRADEGVDVARAKFIVDACNTALAAAPVNCEVCHKPGATLHVEFDGYACSECQASWNTDEGQTHGSD